MSLWSSSSDLDKIWILLILWCRPIVVIHSVPLIFILPLSCGGFATLFSPVRCSHPGPAEFPQAGGLIVADSI